MPLSILSVFVLWGTALVAQIEGAPSWSQYLRDGGLLGAACLLIWALFTERVVPAKRLERELAKADEREATLIGVLGDALERIEQALRREP